MDADIVVVSTFLVARIFMGVLPFTELFLNVKNRFQLIGRRDWENGSNFFNFLFPSSKSHFFFNAL